jgi:catechol-2,3-dioxygenase
MERPRIRHIAINVVEEEREKLAEYYKKTFGMEEKYRGPSGAIYLSDGFVDLALITAPRYAPGIHHFGFQVDSIQAIEEASHSSALGNVHGAVAESWIRDAAGNRIDLSVKGWPV